ncbi:hypothetical protein PROFUN_09776 [Planoprotostelium fungivorum]|uniref:Amylopullulanase X25 domain-containing protein n=1 Tax=Planoprotostelium fungivorum TaxID=1890364 RepID=A0A2P6NGL6_9EUKA|nr:hypothetical protein PROFUN_09776 [Planoprotostelium fungivorum]
MRNLVVLAIVACVAAQIAYPNNPECGWGDQVYRAVGDWAMDAGAGSNWDPSESRGVMTATHAQACEYKAKVSGLRPGKSYQWKVTIGGSYNTNWGCVGFNGPNCTFTADGNGRVVFQIIASYSYPLAALPSSNNSSPTTATPTPTQSPAPGPSNGRFVFAHYMMGYADNNDQAYLEKEMRLAMNVGIDAFAVNVGADGQMGKMHDFMNAARATNFKVFISFDMNEFKAAFDSFTNWMNTFSSDSAYFHYNGKPFVSTFNGNLGGALHNDAWQNWKNSLGGNVYLCPNMFGSQDDNSFNSFPSVDCLFSWAGWGKESSLNEDMRIMSQANGRQYMAPVSPWFFCHLEQWGKNWVWSNNAYDGYEHIYAQRWIQAIKEGAQFVEIVTWNDWSESSYISPLLESGHTFKDSDFYTDGQLHAGYYGMTAYFANWYKNGGTQPSKNSVYWSYRKHATNQQRNDDKGELTFFWSPPDCVAMYAISAQPGAIVNVQIGGRNNYHTVQNTLDSWCVDFQGTGAVRVSVNFNGQTTNAPYNGPDIEGYGQYRNFNPFSGVMDY